MKLPEDQKVRLEEWLGKSLSENLVLACALCNMAKTDFLTYDEFKIVGKAIREIWQQRAVRKIAKT